MSGWLTRWRLALRIARYFDVPVEAVFALEPLPSLSQELLRRTT